MKYSKTLRWNTPKHSDGILQNTPMDVAMKRMAGGCAQREEQPPLLYGKQALRGICSTDLKEATGMEVDPGTALALVRSLARNITIPVKNETIISDMAESGHPVADSTFYLYMNGLKRLFVLREVPAWNPNVRIGMPSCKVVLTDGAYTNLALILSDQSPIQVKVAEYDEAMDFKVKKVFGGSLLRVLRDVREQCDRLNDVSAVIDGKTFIRKETASYPGSSLREVVLNAFCHANFFIRSNIKIEFFPSECRITNPGGVFDAPRWMMS